MTQETTPETMGEQTCPMCLKPSLSLCEFSKDIPFFGVTYFFSMNCDNCQYYKSDLESAEEKEPSKYTININKDDLNIRIVRSSYSTVKIPTLKMDIKPGPSSNGYISNIEGIINRFTKILEQIRDGSEDKSARKSVKNQLKKISDFKFGTQELKIIIEDPTGNSMIISPKAV